VGPSSRHFIPLSQETPTLNFSLYVDGTNRIVQMENLTLILGTTGGDTLFFLPAWLMVIPFSLLAPAPSLIALGGLFS